MIDTIRVSGHGILMDVSLIVYSQHANEDVEKMILGNKCDMGDRRVVSKERGDQVRIRLNHIYIFPRLHSIYAGNRFSVIRRMVIFAIHGFSAF